MGLSSSSGSEDDGDARWKAAISSAAAVDYIFAAGSGRKSTTAVNGGSHMEDQEEQQESKGLKLYQIKARKILEDTLDKNLEFINNEIPSQLDITEIETSNSSVGGIRLFRKAPPGVIFDPIDLRPRPTKKPQIVPGEKLDEKSKKFKRQIRLAAVDGREIMSLAQNAAKKSLSRYEAKAAKAKAAAAKEEQRVAELRKIRGEKWLPSIAREMQVRRCA